MHVSVSPAGCADNAPEQKAATPIKEHQQDLQ